MIGAVDRDATLPWLGHQGWFALLVDVFAVLVLAGVIAALAIRKLQRPGALRGQPPGRGRPDPGDDRRDRLDAAAVAREPDRARPERVAGGLVARGRRPLRPLRRRLVRPRCSSACFVWAHVLLILSFLVYLPHSKHLHIATAAVNVFFGRTRARRAARAAALRRSRGGDALRRRHGRGPHLEADARHVLLHRVRALPGRVPRLDHRQGALAEAAHHGPARPGVRGGPGAAPGRRRLRGRSRSCRAR